MKTLFTFSSLFILYVHAISQPVTTDGSLSPSLSANDYTVTEKKANNKLMERQFTNKTTGKLALNYSRYDDTSFICTEYANDGQELRKGIVAQNNSKAMHYKITKPDLEKDPEMKLGLVKDTIIYDEFFDRHGLWIETTADKKTWQGNYSHELKTGIWKRSKNALQPGNEIDSMIVYQNDQPISSPGKFSSAEELFPLLMGNWYGDRANSGRMYQVFYRKTTTALDNDYLKFSSPEELEMVSKAGSDKLSWSFENNQLAIKKSDFVSKVSIVYLDGKTLIIRNLSN